MNKKLISAALVLSLAALGTACSSTAKEEATASATTVVSAAPTTVATPAEDANMYKAYAYIAARLAEEKIAVLFQSQTTDDGKAIMNTNAAADKAQATEFLNTYLDPALTEKVLAHFLTEEKVGEATVVNVEPFVPVSILTTASKDEVTYEGDANEVKMTTKDGGVFTAKKTSADNYVITDITKQ
ncbi:MAG: hypothetical protein K6T85_02175 [Gorillibacterium sp.]|nr:hypothetical protein [Gorillibacterium sp.]